MLRTLTAFCLLLALGGCATQKGRVETQYVHVGIDPALTDPNACPSWPQSSDVIIDGNEAEGSDYVLKGYEAYRCERSTRMKIREQDQRQAADVEKRNGKEAPKAQP